LARLLRLMRADLNVSLMHLGGMMRVARSIVVLFALPGGWSVAACAPPTPKAEPFAPHTVEREGVAPARDQDWSFQ